MTESTAELFDLGYQRYDGPREGRMRARRALWMDGLRTALGIGRGAKAKILPVLLFMSVMSPAVIIIVIVSVADIASVDLPNHAEYYQFVSLLLFLFSAIMAPELIIPDRRDGVINLYLVRPLSTTDYVIGRWLAFFTITIALLYSGQLLLFVGLTIAAMEPWEYVRNNWLDAPRFIAGGLSIAFFTTTIPMMVSSFTNRRAYATAFVIGIFIISPLFAGALVECEDEVPVVQESGGQTSLTEHQPCEPVAGDSAKWFALLDLTSLNTVHINNLIFGLDAIENNESNSVRYMGELHDGVVIGWWAFLIVGSGALLWWRYRKLSL